MIQNISPISINGNMMDATTDGAFGGGTSFLRALIRARRVLRMGSSSSDEYEWLDNTVGV